LSMLNGRRNHASALPQRPNGCNLVRLAQLRNTVLPLQRWQFCNDLQAHHAKPLASHGGKVVIFQFDQTRITVNVPDRTALAAGVSAHLRAGQGFALATINLDHLVKLTHDPAFRTAYAAQTLVVADGNPIVWLSRLARRPVTLVPGSDMVIPLARLAAAAGVKVALVGSSDAALAGAATHLAATASGIKITTQIAPPYGFDPGGPDADRILRQLQSDHIGLCFIALGAPKQELFAARGRSLAPNVGFASVGAGLDFLAGNQTRAPAWVRAIAMEWLWRALSSPRRLIPRYAACAAILPAQIIAAWKLRP
jgi:N-acetylglucosaminyldiphosphoundecaprenol N-acetyl-beta-D-mannosaminyltransferase